MKALLRCGMDRGIVRRLRCRQLFYRRCRIPIQIIMADERGFVFHTRNGDVDMDISQVKDLAAKGDPDGLYALAMAYLYGWDVPEDRGLGFEYLEKAVEAGQLDAKALMVSLYMQGEYDGIDSDKAAEYSIEAAAEGIPEAQLYAGLAYMDGVSVQQDYAEAARMFRLAMNQGNQEARTNLGYLYQNGLGVEKDEAKAFKLYRTSAKSGNVSGLFHMGVCCEFGIGTEVDYVQAKECYEEGAKMGDPFAAERLGFLYSQGLGELSADAEKSFECFLQGATGGSVSAMYMVGYMYLHGIGTEKSEEEAMKWLKMASDNGYEEAVELLTILARCFYTSLPMVAPIPMSDSIQDRAEAGEAEAQYQMGLNYIYGTDVPKDASKAAFWFSKAAEQGYLPAKREIGILLASGEGVEPDMERAVQYLSEAADQLDPSALYHLGIMYESGIGIDKDLQKAVRMLAYAAEMGYPGADVDAERVDNILTEERNRKLRARPILRLQISDVDVEAACCKRMLDALLAQDIVFIDSYKGPALLGEDQDGMDAVLESCPFCGARIQLIPHDTKF